MALMNGHRFVSYAQNHEDVVLARALRPDERTGFWVDVGAGDPVVDSVTAAFAARGWRGVNVEPLPGEHSRLRAARPRDTNLQIALGATTGRGTLFVEPTREPERPDAEAPIARALSTMVPELAERYRADGQEFIPIEVPVCTLAQVVAEHVPGPVDFLKIDVEGSEGAVLAGVDWTDFRPRVVVVEATVPMSDEPAHEEWEPILLGAGYRFAMFDGLNRFYAHSDEPALVQTLSVPANVFDDFVPYTWTHQIDQVQQWAHRLQDALAYEQEQAASARAETQHIRTELDALKATRTFRSTAALRTAYTAARRAFSRRT
jgi:FkbM family methyltransferase